MRKAFLVLLPALAALASAQAKDAGRIVVEVRHDGKPVAAANVTVDDGAREQDALIDPSAKGDAAFSGVKPGSLKVTVHYRAAGKDAAPVIQIFATRPAGDATPHVTVALPEAAATLGDAAPAPPAVAATPTVKSAPPEASGGFNPVGALFALVFGAAAAGGIWWYIKKNPEGVGGALERLGAQIPKPGDAPLADPPVASAPAPLAPAPPQKIVLDPVAPAPVPIQMAAPIAVAVSEPSLVTDAGVPIPLAEGETVVGRDVGLALSLAGESTVSRRHARLVRSGGSVTLEDLGSTNGTFVNGAPAPPSTTLTPGDAVQFGSVRFRYEG